MCPTPSRLWLDLSDLAPRKSAPRRHPAFRRPLLERLEDRTVPSTFTVLNTLDSGAGSLRQAILDADAAATGTAASPDLIRFNIPTSNPGYNATTGTFSIKPLSALPTVTDTLVLDGYTQPGASPNTLAVGDNAVLKIELDGRPLSQSHPGGATAYGLAIGAGHSTVQGLAIHGFSYEGSSTLGDVNWSAAIVLVAHGGNHIQGNFIGTDVSGEIAPEGLPTYSPYAPRGPMSTVGVLVESGSDGNVVGTDGNGVNDPGERNVISANVVGVAAHGVSMNVVAGNFIGTDRTGTQALGNWDGVGMSNTVLGDRVAVGNRIGTNGTDVDAVGERNIISGNFLGVGATGVPAPASSGTVVAGNYIGTDVTGHNALGNQAAGVAVSFGESNWTIGGPTPALANTIAYNGFAFPTGPKGPGIWVFDLAGLGPPSGIRIQGNSIHDNAGLGIDLGGDYLPDGSPGPDGVTPNDSLGHAGPNNYQDFPSLTAASSSATSTVVTGTFSEVAEPNTTLTLDFYANPVADLRGYGQGQTYLGSATVTTDPSGNASFLATLPAAAAVGEVISATATDPNGNTSEFSADITVQAASSIPTGESIAISGGTNPGNLQVSLNGTALPTFTGSGPLYVEGSTGSPDTYTVTFGSTLTTPIYLSGGGSNSGDTLLANGDNSSTNVINKTPSQITWGSPVTETVYRSGIPNTTINANGTSQNYVNDPGSNTVINGGPGTNNISITATTGNGVVINGGPHANNYTITMGNLLGPVAINSTAGTSTVTVNAPTGSNVLTLSSTRLTGDGETINFNLGSTATKFTVSGGVGNNNQLVLQGSPPGPLTAQNLAPTVGAITAPLAPTAINTAIAASAGFTNLDGNAQTAVWSWGDGTTSSGSVSQSGTTGTVTGSHSYTTDGVFTITLTVTDSQGGGATTAAFQYAVVYNPSAGFVTGGGWFNSPAGAVAASPTLTGKANFGFNAKYQSGATVPTGDTEFHLPAANLNFHSTSYDWLVVSGAQAQFQGSGTINGAGNYGFFGTAVQGSLLGTPGPDAVRIKIWDKNNNNAVVYDSQPGATTTAAPTTTLGGGAIQVHASPNGLQLAAGLGPVPAAVAALTPEELAPVVQEAKAEWRAVGLDAAQEQALDCGAVYITDLPAPYVGLASPGAAWINVTAAGLPWFIDPSPAADSLFAAGLVRGQMDLLSVVAHELGHVLGLAYEGGDGIMTGSLAAGVRLYPQASDLLGPHGPSATGSPAGTALPAAPLPPSAASPGMVSRGPVGGPALVGMGGGPEGLLLFPIDVSLADDPGTTPLPPSANAPGLPGEDALPMSNLLAGWATRSALGFRPAQPDTASGDGGGDDGADAGSVDLFFSTAEDDALRDSLN